MRILLLGGAVFLGRALIDEALARGHEVTTFNRGRSAPDPPGVRAVHGDRTAPGELDRVLDRDYDAVVDTSGFVPRVVLAGAQALARHAPAYAYVSSISAYDGWPARPVPGAPLHACPPDAGPGDGDYGVLKAGCERAVRQAYGDDCVLLRAGLLTGPHDNVGRLPWWLRRIARGGRVLAPGAPDRPVQLVDVRDVAAFTLDLLETGRLGDALDVTGPSGQVTLGDVLEACREATGSAAELVWVDDAALLAAGVQPWTELPLWAPRVPDMAHTWDVDTAPAQALGLRTRPVRDSVLDAWAALAAGDEPRPPREGLPPVGLDPATEQRVLQDLTTDTGSPR